MANKPSGGVGIRFGAAKGAPLGGGWDNRAGPRRVAAWTGGGRGLLVVNGRRPLTKCCAKRLAEHPEPQTPLASVGHLT